MKEEIELNEIKINKKEVLIIFQISKMRPIILLNINNYSFFGKLFFTSINNFFILLLIIGYIFNINKVLYFLI